MFKTIALMVFALGTSVGPSFGPAEPVWVPASGQQNAATLVWNGSGYLASWSDTREETPNFLYAGRLSPAGEPLERAGIVLGSGGNQVGAALAWNGTNHIAAWIQSGPITSPPDTFINMAVVSPGGAVGTPRRLGPSNTLAPVAASAGTTTLVAWLEDRDRAQGHVDVRGVRLGAGGESLDAQPLLLATGPTTKRALNITSDGTSFLVLWNGAPPGRPENEIAAVRVSGEGQVSPSAIPVAAGAGERRFPVAVWTGTHHYVVWSEQVSLREWRMKAARLDVQGQVLDPAGIVLVDMPGYDQSLESLFKTPAGAALVFTQRPSVLSLDPSMRYVSRVDAAGQLGPLVPFTIPGRGTYAAATSETLKLTSLPVQDGRNENDLWATRLNGDLQPVGPPVVAATAANIQRAPAVSARDTEMLVVWQDARAGGPLAIYGARIGADGRPQDGTGFVIAEGMGLRWRPAVTASADGYLVSWTESDNRDGNSRVRAARITPDGKVAAGGSVLAQAGIDRATAVASDGQGFLLVWSVFVSASGWDLRALRLDAGGAPVGAELTVTSGLHAQKAPAIAWDGQNYLVVWEDGRHGREAIYGARVTAAGNVLDVEGIGIAKQDITHRTPAVVWNGTHHLVAWNEYGPTGASTGVRGVRLTRDGQIVDPSPVTLAAPASGGSAPTLAWDGNSHLLVWTALTDPPGTRVQARRLSADLQAGDPLEGVRVGGQGSGDRTPALAAAPGRAALVVWQNFEVAEGSVRVRAVLLEEAAPPDAGADAGVDAAIDAAIDAPPDVALEAPPADAGTADAAPDARGDAATGKGGGGCSCRLAEGKTSPAPAALVLLVLVLVSVRSRPSSAHGRWSRGRRKSVPPRPPAPGPAA